MPQGINPWAHSLARDCTFRFKERRRKRIGLYAGRHLVRRSCAETPQGCVPTITTTAAKRRNPARTPCGCKYAAVRLYRSRNRARYVFLDVCATRASISRSNFPIHIINMILLIRLCIIRRSKRGNNDKKKIIGDNWRYVRK